MTRVNDWYMRVNSPSGAKASLGFGYEYWLLDPERYEGHAELAIVAGARGYRWGKRQLAYELVEDLLTDVIAAAGGVERSIVALREAAAEAQEWSDQHSPPNPPSVRRGIGHPSVTRAWYEFANTLTWARAVEERTDRKPLPKKGSHQLPRQGLVHAVRPVRLKKRLDTLVAELRSGPMAETRLLANFTLHCALVRNPNTFARVSPTGNVVLAIPDRTTTAVAHRKLFTWNDGRDALSFAELLWETIEQFTDNVLDAFEEAVPKRLRAEVSI